MQGAFIDALVTPVFKSLADLLPLVEENCIKTLTINRAFWNSMQAHNIVTTDSIISYLKSIRSTSADSNQEFNEKDVTSDSNQQYPGTPIPGIPTNAPEGGLKKRFTSMIPIIPRVSDPLDPELGAHPISETRHSEHKAPSTKQPFCNRLRSRLKVFLNSIFCQVLLLLATVYALFANDLNFAFGSKEADNVIEFFTFLVLVAFIWEIILSTICISKYLQFFFWLDLAACVSLLLEVDLPFQLGNSPGDLSLTKASRAAKVGARAGR